MSASLSPLSLVLEVWDHHHEVQLSMLIKFMCNMSLLGGPGAQDSDWGHVGVPGAGVVGHRGQGPTPQTPA